MMRRVASSYATSLSKAGVGRSTPSTLRNRCAMTRPSTRQANPHILLKQPKFVSCDRFRSSISQMNRRSRNVFGRSGPVAPSLRMIDDDLFVVRVVWKGVAEGRNNSTNALIHGVRFDNTRALSGEPFRVSLFSSRRRRAELASADDVFRAESTRGHRSYLKRAPAAYIFESDF